MQNKIINYIKHITDATLMNWYTVKTFFFSIIYNKNNDRRD